MKRPFASKAAWVVGGAALLVLVPAALLTPGAAASDGLDVEDVPEGAMTQNVVVVGVPGLRWQQVSQQGMPNLWDLAGRGSTGAMSVRSARSRTCPGDGWVQLGAGNRARSPVPEEPKDAQKGLCPPAPAVDTSGAGAKVPSWPEIVLENEELNFGAEPGILAQTLDDAGACIAAIGPQAPLGTADEDGNTALWASAPGQVEPGMLDDCAVTVVGADELVDGVTRRDLSDVDEIVGQVDEARPDGSIMIVVGLSEVLDEPPSLHVAVAEGPGFEGGELVSTSTRRAPFVQSSDIAPTILSLLGIPQPSAMTYGPWRHATPDTSLDIGDEVSRLVEYDDQAQQVGRLIPPFFVALVLTQAVLYLLAYLALRRVSNASRRRWVLAGTHILAVAYAAGPVATFLANIVPWWRVTYPLPVLLLSVTIAGGLVTLLAFLGPWRRHPFGPSGCVAVVTALVLAIDVISGANLQLSSLAGYSPIVAGRFAGFGNLAFATFAAGAILGAAALMSGRSRRASVTIASLVGVFAVLVDGLPMWGSDFGGVIALVPAFVVLGVTVTGSRISWRMMVMLVVLGGAVVTLISLVDYLRPADAQTHLGRFVGQVLDGTAGLVVQRKLEANLNLLTNSVLTLLVPLALIFLVFLIRRPRGLLPWTFRQVPTLRPGLTAVLVMGVLGALVNDSGVAVPVMAATLVLPVVIAVVAASLQRADASGNVPEAVAGPLPDPGS